MLICTGKYQNEPDDRHRARQVNIHSKRRERLAVQMLESQREFPST
jgi:hypothetical protein